MNTGAVDSADFLVIGGGVVGLSIARELKVRFADQRVVLLEKEQGLGLHASGRNSGVIHAGFYYSAESLKAKFTRAGNLAMTEYCEERGIALNRCGKLVVAKDESELIGLEELLARGVANGVPLESVTAKEALEIEPRAVTHRRAIFSPTTSSADPGQVIAAMEADARREGVEIRVGERYLGMDGELVKTSRASFKVGHVVNAAGLYADVIAKDMGFSKDYAILPFKGLYLKSSEPKGSYRTHIYPVPDLKYPFLGVHFTVQVDGSAKIGPTAIPAVWREQYGLIDGFDLKEFLDIAFRSLRLFGASDFDFSGLALAEVKKYSKRHMVRLAKSLARDINEVDFARWGAPGIRAQLINKKKNSLEMDFVIEGDSRSTHVLNAVSPGWTCSLPFSDHVVSHIEQSIK